MWLCGLLEICERESVKKSECGLSCWVVLPAARKRRERKTGQVWPDRKAYAEEVESVAERI